MRKIILMAIVALIMSVQSLCGAAEVYSDFFHDEEDLIYPVCFLKQDPDNEEDVSRPVAMDTGKKQRIDAPDGDG